MKTKRKLILGNFLFTRQKLYNNDWKERRQSLTKKFKRLDANVIKNKQIKSIKPRLQQHSTILSKLWNTSLNQLFKNIFFLHYTYVDYFSHNCFLFLKELSFRCSKFASFGNTPYCLSYLRRKSSEVINLGTLQTIERVLYYQSSGHKLFNKKMRSVSAAVGDAPYSEWYSNYLPNNISA